MLSMELSERVDALIDDLILDGGVEAASLASILLASKDSLKGEYLGTLSRRVWVASSELKAGYALDQVNQAGPEALESSGDVAPHPCCRTVEATSSRLSVRD